MIYKSFNDDWLFESRNGKRKVTLPHDAMLEEKRYAKGYEFSGNAYFDGGYYIYTKEFNLTKDYKNKKIFLEVLGCYPNASIILNEKELNKYDNGYSTYLVDLTNNLLFDEVNVLKIICDNTLMPNSRWYSGAGLYRGLNLLIGNNDYILNNELKINVLNYNPLTIFYDVKYVGCNDLNVKFEIYDNDKLVKSINGSSNTLELDLKLWSDVNPYLYKIKVLLEKNNEVLDTYSFDYGFRHLEFNTNGLFVNGIKTILKGACLHHDNGILGAKSYFDIEYRKLEVLKSYGFNAIRSSHNPSSKTLLDACDKLGIYVMDELSDMWYNHKNPYDYATYFEANYMKDLKLMIEKDYNHPSVILYSLGNELSEPTSDSILGIKILNDMVTYIHENDYRKSTLGINFTNLPRPELDKYKQDARMFEIYENKDSVCDEFNEVVVTLGESMADISIKEDSERVAHKALELLDVAGYNYAYKKYYKDDLEHKDRIIVGTETMCKDIYQNKKIMDEIPRVIGDFIWTGIDYLGEVGVGGYNNEKYFSKPYPWILANAGALDLLYMPTGEAALAKISYGKSNLLIFTRMPKEDETLSGWRWTNSLNTYSYGNNLNKKVIVEVFSNYPVVELFLNNKSLGKKEVTKGYVTYEIEYIPGVLKAIGFDSESNIKEEYTLKTVSESKLSLRLDYKGSELSLLYIEYKDKDGIIDTLKSNEIKIDVEGGILLGFGSANPITENNYLSNITNMYKGQALAIIKNTDKNCKVKVSSNDDLKTIII